MSLFKKKKEEMRQRIKPPVFPGLPENNFPTYEPAMPSDSDEIKRAVEGFEDPFEEPKIRSTPKFLPEEKSIFVKVDKYKEAIDTLELIKEKLKTSQAILNELKELKAREESELQEWQNSMNDLKEKLTLIDNNLFEL